MMQALLAMLAALGNLFEAPPAPLVKALPVPPWSLVAAPTCNTFELPPEELRLLQAADAIRLGGHDAVTQRDASKPRVDSALLPRRNGLAPPLAIGIMVRNAGAFLLNNFKELHAGILSRSVDWRVFYVENDSCDDTREILHSLEALYPGKVVGDQLTLQKVDSVKMCPRRYSNCPMRIRMLAWLRQRVLDRALAWPDAQLYINIDMDFDPFDFRSDHFWQMYTNVMLPCGADAVYPMNKFSPRSSRCNGPFGCDIYDYGAVIPVRLLNSSLRQQRSPIVPVTSSHSGFPMFRLASLREFNASYAEVPLAALFAASADNPHDRLEWGTIETTWISYRLPRLYAYTKFQPSYAGMLRPGVRGKVVCKHQQNKNHSQFSPVQNHSQHDKNHSRAGGEVNSASERVPAAVS